MRVFDFALAVKWARLECKSYKIPEPATAIEPDDQVPSFFAFGRGGAGGRNSKRYPRQQNQDGPGTILSRRDYAPKTGRQAMIRNWRELVWLVVFVFLFGAALLANVSDRPLAEHRGMWITQALR